MSDPLSTNDTPDIFRSAVLFFLTMGTVFSGGMLWSTYGDDIKQKWNDDLAGMKSDWKKATTPDREKQRKMMGFGWQRDHDQNFQDIAHELENTRMKSRGYDCDFETGSSFSDAVREL